MKHQPDKIARLLIGEAYELSEAIEEGRGFRSEMADVLIYLLTLAIATDTDLDAEVREKMAFNILRWDWHKFQDGDFEQARIECKSHEQELKDEFYE